LLFAAMLYALPCTLHVLFAQQSAQVEITVTPGVTRALSVQLAGGTTSYDLGSLNLNALTVGTTAFEVTNVGNIITSYSIQITTESDTGSPAVPWTADESLADLSETTDRYQLFAVFDSSASTAPPSVSPVDAFLVKKSPRTASATQFAGPATGADVSAVPDQGRNVRRLWFGIQTSGYTTTPSQKRVGVTLTAQ